MARKTFNEKLKDSKDMPKIVEVTDPAAVARYFVTMMLLASPFFYDEILKKVPSC